MKMLKIDEEFKNLLPPLTDDERSELENDIKKHGVLSPIITWNGFIIDGHNRYEICQRNGIEIPATKELEFANKSDVMDWIIKHQTGRRNLTRSQLVKAYSVIEEQLRKEAKERQVSAGKEFGKGGSKVVANLPQAIEKKRNSPTTEQVAQKMGVSRKTYEGMRTIVNEGSAEQIERMDKGGKGNGVSAIVAEIKETKLNQDVPDGYKRCNRCGKIKPIDEFQRNCDSKDGKKSLCKDCVSFRKRSIARKFSGEITPMEQRFESLTEEEVVGDLYQVKNVTFDDVLDDFKETSNGWVASIMRIIDSNKKEFQEKENREKMCGALACLETEILKMKERVNAYE